MTCGLGIARFDPDQPRLPDELVNEADRRLYLAKQGGRDRIVDGG